MNKLLIATAVVATLGTSAAYADGFYFGGYGEYAVEAEAFELGLNANYAINDFTLGAEIVMADVANDFGLDAVTLSVAYAVTTNVDAYAKVELDSDLNYSEAYIGASFKF